MTRTRRTLMERSNHEKPVLITGGAGFIGSNVAHRYLCQSQPVIVFDNLSRRGVAQNLQWLKERHGSLLQFVEGDVRNGAALDRVVRKASRVFHFAAQVAVTTSLANPIDDFEVNARGTLNLLEAIRALPRPIPLLFTSTNKVYGDLADVPIGANGERYEPEDSELRKNGFSEQRRVDFHSPYGCSKGAADQYVLDYARTFDMPAVVFRMSCIYGSHQFGNEDQGWVAHFLIRALANAPLTIYGDGKQVRDILFIDDLVDAFMLAHENIRQISGQAFNIGGGPSNTVSLLELLDLMEHNQGKYPEIKFDDWRAADQLYYVSDTRKFSEATGWKTKVDVREGLTRLNKWVMENKESVAEVNTDFAKRLNVKSKASNGSRFKPTLTKPASRSRRVNGNGGAQKKFLQAS